MAVDPSLEMVLQEARSALSVQAADLDSIRSRASQLLGSGGLVAAFLGGLAIRDQAPIHAWTVASAAAFACVAVAVTYVNWARTWTFSNNALKVLSWDRIKDENYVAEHLARFLAQHHSENATTIMWLARGYSFATIAFLAEIVFLFLDLKGR